MSRPPRPEPDFRKLFESAPGQFLVLEPDIPRYTIIGVTDAYTRATMTQRDELVGRGLFEVFPGNPADPEGTGVRNLAASLERVVRDRVSDPMAVQKYDIRRPTEEGGHFEERFWSSVNSPVLGRDGELLCIIHRAEDVTDFVRLKQSRAEAQELTKELRFRSEKMESEIFVRGQQIQEANEKLRDANAEITRLYEKTRELDELKTQFFANVSHELRTPLTLILGPAERMLAAPETTEAQRHGLETIARSARGLRGLVDDLLDVSKLEAGQMQLDYSETDLASVARFVGALFETVASDKNITCRLEVPEALWAEVDADKFQRILVNLLSNAFKFTPHGGRMRLSLRSEADRVEVQVADSGPGIPPDAREAIFERFRQLEGGTARRFGGTGLGLAITSDFATLHRGSVSVADAPEGGALFTVSIPRTAPRGSKVRPRTAAAPEAAPRPETAPAPAQTAPGVADAPLVLVVEDSSEMSRFLCEALAGTYRLATAFNGKEGLAKAIELRPDLILADVMMPEMGGAELLAALRKRPEFSTVPVIVLTARADDALRIRLLRSGAQDYLTKPFVEEELRARVRNLIAAHHAEQALRFSEARSSGILAVSADALISIDEDQRITMFNDGAERIFGYSKTEAIGSPLDKLIPERFHSIHRHHVERFAAGEDIVRSAGHRGAEIRGQRKDGEVFPADAAISKIEVAGRKVLTVAIRDITEEQRIAREERFLAEASALLSSSLDYEQTLATVATMAVGAFADWCGVDLVEEGEGLMRLKVASADPTRAALCARLERLPPDREQHHLARAVIEMRRPILLEHVTRQDLEAYAQGREHLEALLAVGATSAMAVPLLRQDHAVGVLVFVSSTASHVYGPSDIRFAEALAERAAVAIENARLYRAANRAIRVRDDVLSVVAHDLRSPLSAILMSVDVLRHSDGARCRRSTNAIERSANRMNRLIEDLLDVTRMEAGRLAIEQARLRTAQLVREALEAARPLTSSASLELELDLSPDLPDVWADRDRLVQVFENLIGNAMKFTEPGGRILVGAAPRDGEALFWVADTGVGIAADDVPHLFDRFWQARKAAKGGAGLGLPIVKGIVEAHGGRIWVDSTLGSGSTFFFTIPTSRAEQSRQEPAPHAR